MIDDIRSSEYANISKPIAYMPVADKVTRMMAESAKIEARQVHLPRRAPWLAEFHDEVLAVPPWPSRRPGRRSCSISRLDRLTQSGYCTIVIPFPF